MPQISQCCPLYDVPCKTHIGIQYVIARKPRAIRTNQLVRPKGIILFDDIDMPIKDGPQGKAKKPSEIDHSKKIGWEEATQQASSQECQVKT